MSFEQELKNDQMRETYERIKQEAARIVNRVATWESQRADLLKQTSDSSKQAEIDAIKNQLVSSIRAALDL